MTETSPPYGPWPDPAGALDDALDVAAVIAATGCSPEDLKDLGGIFLQETDNMLQRLEQARQALTAQEDSPDWPAATERLRTAAHELTTSFGIVGAKRAEGYSRVTQTRLRKRSAQTPAPVEPPPSAQDLRTAAQALQAAVQRVASLLQAG